MNDRLLRSTIRDAEGRLAVSFVQSIEWLRRQLRILVDDAHVIDAAQTYSDVQRAADLLTSEWRAVYTSAAMTTAGWVATEVGRLVAFDIAHWQSMRTMQEASIGLHSMVDSQAQVTSQVRAWAIGQGNSQGEVNRLVRDTLGLTPSQANALIRYRVRLGPGAMRSQSAPALGNPVTDEQTTRVGMPPRVLNTTVERYRARLLARRGQSIGVLEGRRAVHAAMYDAIAQAAEVGDIVGWRVAHTWHTRKDPLVRDWHDPMEGQVRYGDEPFRSGLGNALRYPGDPMAPLVDTAGCRCRTDTKLLPTRSIAS